ncbi:hypothetical protein [Sphingomonas sp.]|uniref:hypothetical protein n=1 Tax=Sphingomonas sp. TaxID=28214 RepID=UPI0038AED2B4
MRAVFLLALAAFDACSPASGARQPPKPELIVVTGPGPDWIKHVPMKDRIDPKSRECTDHAARLAAIAKKDHVDISDHRAFIDRAVWEAGAKADWEAITWGMAYMNSCNAGARGTHSIAMFDRDESIRDPMKRMLAYRNVSTRLECHGDHAVMGPDDIWYLC